MLNLKNNVMKSISVDDLNVKLAVLNEKGFDLGFTVSQKNKLLNLINEFHCRNLSRLQFEKNIKKTKDFIFKKHPVNREIKINNILSIIKSILDSGYFPEIVNVYTNFKIIKHQHGAIAAYLLDEEIPYTIIDYKHPKDKENKEILLMTSDDKQRKYSPDDIIKNFKNEKGYMPLMELRHKLSSDYPELWKGKKMPTIPQTLAALTNNANYLYGLKDGVRTHNTLKKELKNGFSEKNIKLAEKALIIMKFIKKNSKRGEYKKIEKNMLTYIYENDIDLKSLLKLFNMNDILPFDYQKLFDDFDKGIKLLINTAKSIK